jgi:phytanoyl-CoA hydroxylase
MGLLDFLRRQKPADPPPALGEDGLLTSDLLIDRPDALAEIERRLAKGQMSEGQAEHLRRMSRDGYTVLDLELGPGVFEAIDADVERLWRDKPADVAYAYHSPLTRFSDAEDEHRRPSCRIADMHSASEAALDLFLHPELSALAGLIFGEPAVSLQSLYFQWGSQQALHRDPVHVLSWPPSHLLAAWVALEEIGPDCGPLVYVPGSHRLPYYQYEPRRYTFKHGVYGDAEVRASEAFDRENYERAGLSPIPFTGPRGKAFLWHHSLLHGGSLPVDPALTRKSFVIHFSTRSTQKHVLNSYQGWSEPGRQGERSTQVLVTDRLIERGPCAGFASPLAAGKPWTPTP